MAAYRNILKDAPPPPPLFLPRFAIFFIDTERLQGQAGPALSSHVVVTFA